MKWWKSWAWNRFCWFHCYFLFSLQYFTYSFWMLRSHMNSTFVLLLPPWSKLAYKRQALDHKKKFDIEFGSSFWRWPIQSILSKMKNLSIESVSKTLVSWGTCFAFESSWVGHKGVSFEIHFFVIRRAENGQWPFWHFPQQKMYVRCQICSGIQPTASSTARARPQTYSVENYLTRLLGQASHVNASYQQIFQFFWLFSVDFGFEFDHFGFSVK